MNKIMKCCLVFIISLTFLFGDQVSAEKMDSKIFVLVVVPDLSITEMEWIFENGQSDRLWSSGGFAAMNVRPEGPYSYLNNAVSLSIGARGLGVKEWNAFEEGDVIDGIKASDLFLQWTGSSVVKGSLIHPYFHRLLDKNNHSPFRGQVGILGEVLKENNVHRFVMGNSDVMGEKIRYGSLFTVDKSGLSTGILSEVTKEAMESPSGHLMDVNKLVEVLEAIHQGQTNSFVVIEWGDVHRLFEQMSNMTDEHFQHQYEKRLLELEGFLDVLYGDTRIDEIMLLSPMMNSEAYKNKERLAPLYFWDGDRSTFNLASKTTNQPFLVSNLDIVPTIFHSFNIPYKMRYGQKIEQTPIDRVNHQQILKSLNLMFLIFKTRNVILSSYTTLLVLLLILVSIVILVGEKKEAWKSTAKVLLISGISSPLWLLVTPYFLNYIPANFYLLLLILCSYFSGFILVYWTKHPVRIICWATFVAITGDLVFNQTFIQRSYLGYDPIIGARYYGIGNEYAGIYLICGLLLLDYKKVKKWMLISIVAISQVFIMTTAGANAGATLSAVIMFGYLLCRYYLPKMNWKRMFTYVLMAILAGLVILFVTQKGQSSHISIAFEQLFNGDFTYIVDIIKRKLEMNWKIFRYSNWTQLFVTTYLLIAVYLWRGKNIVKDEQKKLLIQTGVVASIALLLLNDSGVVAAATSMFMIVCTSYFWSLVGD